MTFKSLMFLSAMVIGSALSMVAAPITGTVTAPGAKTQEGSVVYIEAVPGSSASAPAQKFTLGQQWLAFKPHVLVVPVNATVEFRNDDTVPHNVMWPSVGGNTAMKNDLGTWQPGDSKTFTFTHAGVVPVRCSLHPGMAAYVVVTPTSYSAVTDRSGHFTIKDVPPGHYRLVAWHEGYKTEVKAVDAGSAAVTFTLSK